ncbi:Uncharacterized protein GBIM_15212 [Gryllus bimaculatus]|nr:Uncharacterized protein GBIM_15212 [Gryllus bimaculatus]
MLIAHTPEDKIREDPLKSSEPQLKEMRRLARGSEVPWQATQQMESDMDVAAMRKTTERKLVSSEIRKQSKEKATDDNYTVKQRIQEKYIKSSFAENRRKSCKACFIKHDRKDCRFFKATCFVCGRKGHIAEVCLSSSEIYIKRKTVMEVDRIGEILTSDRNTKTVEIVDNCGN